MTHTVETICCKQEMEKTYSAFNGEEATCFRCLKCGAFTSVIDGTLDDEELDELRIENGLEPVVVE